MKEQYEGPEMEIIVFDTVDILATSTPGGDDNEGPFNPDF